MEEHAKLFDGLLQLIPARHYITEKPEVEEGKNPYMQNKRKNAPKQAIKDATKKAKKAKVRFLFTDSKRKKTMAHDSPLA